MKRAALLLTFMLAWPAVAQAVPTGHEIAAKDLTTVRADRRPYTRYLLLPEGYPEKILDLHDPVETFWSNSLSRETEITKPKRVAKNVWRIDLEDYKWTPELWEKLADFEPWFTVRIVNVDKDTRSKTVVIDHPGGDLLNPNTGKVLRDWPKGRYSYEVPDTKGRAKNAAGSWVPEKAFAYLATETRSQVPCVRLDWWLTEVTVPNQRGTGYYDWLFLGTKEADFEKLVGADRKKASAFAVEIGAIIGDSTVTLNNRALDRFDALRGPYWRSRDFDDSKGIKNVIRLLDKDIKEQANEIYGTLPNRLFAFWLQNGDGVRQDAAPDFIASDGKAPTPNRRVQTGLSCVRCHDAAGGIQPIDDWARTIYSPPFKLEDRIYEEQKRKRAKYLSDLQEAIEEDQARYAKILKKVNGLTPAENAKAVAEVYAYYAVRKRSLADVALELGLDKEKMLAAFKAEAEKQGLGFDPVIAALMQGKSLRVEYVEELVPLIYEIVVRHGDKP